MATKDGEERFYPDHLAGPAVGPARAAAVPPRPQPLDRRPEAFLEGEPSVSDDLSPLLPERPFYERSDSARQEENPLTAEMFRARL